MKKEQYRIVRNKRIAPGTFELVLEGNGNVDGEFVHIAIPGFYLRRPLSICDKGPGSLTIVYKVVGKLAWAADSTRMPAVVRPCLSEAGWVCRRCTFWQRN